MPFQLSPGVNVTEIDLTTVIPAVATTDAAIGGIFQWGPVDKPTLVVSEDELASEYGKPNSNNFETWMTAASYLAYSNRLYVSRAHHSTGTDLRVSGFTVTGADYIVVAGNTETGVATGDVVAATISGITETTVAVDTTDVSESVDLTTLDANTDVFGVGLSTIVEGEQVTIVSDDTLPTGISNTENYYVVNASSSSFQLSTTQGGTAINFVDQGVGNITMTRSGSTRITMVGETYTGVDAAAVFEFHDAAFSFNAIANTSAISSTSTLSNHIVKNEDAYDAAEPSFDNNVMYIAKYPGALGNSLKVSVCDSAAAFNSTVTIASGDVTTLAITVGANTGTVSSAGGDSLVTAVTDQLNVGDQIKVGNTAVGIQYLTVSQIGTVSSGSATINFEESLAVSEDIAVSSSSTAAASFQRFWGYWDLVEAAPGQSLYVGAQGNTAANDELHLVVIDEDGAISGRPGEVLEVWQRLSRATDAKDEDGAAIYYKEAINQSSRYVWWANDRTGALSATAQLVASSTQTEALELSFSLGRDIGNESTANIGDILRAYDQFKSAEDIDVSLVLTGKSRGGVNGSQLANYIVDNICERRKDCVAFISPERSDVVDNVTDITEDVVAFRNSCRSTSYAVLDSGYKYMYDKYNDVYRWVPLNGDTAGLCAYTDDVRDPWWSPAGFNRGQIKNVVKLAWNPKKGERDILYKNGCNPIVNFPGQGIIMFGDKTMLSKPSAFDRINVRRLFIVLEKAIATAAKFTLFEFNDDFTRSSFVNLVTPFLRDVQGRRGITDFVVIADETNNTGEVIDRNEFVGDIYIKPTRSINFIQLNFVAVRSGVEFSEVIGNF